MDLDDGITLRAADDPTQKNELRRAWIADRLDERLGEFGETHAVDVVCATWNANGKDVTKLNLDLEPWLRSQALPSAHYNVFVYVLALLRDVLAKSWQTTAATRLASVARDAFLPGGESDARAHVFSAVQFLLTSNL